MVIGERQGQEVSVERHKTLKAVLGAMMFAWAAVACLLAPFNAVAQSVRTYRVAYVNAGSDTEERKPVLVALRNALRELGYVEGRNLIFEARFADGDPDRLRVLVDDLILSKPDVLLGFEDVAQVMRSKTTSIPIVLTGALEPVSAGLAQSLARPGLNVTGSTQLMDQLVAKHVEILKEMLPRLTRIGQFVDDTASGCRLVASLTRRAAERAGIVFVAYHVKNQRDIEQAFLRLQAAPVDALIPCPSPILFSARTLLFEEALRLRTPFSSFVVANVPAGVLFAYAATAEEGYRRAATYVDRILKGAKPGEIPIEQPREFKFVINLRTARATGITIPPQVLLRADRVVE